MARTRRSPPPPPPPPIAFAPVDDAPEVALREAGEAPVVAFECARAQAPQGDPLVGHTAFVQALAFSPDGRTLVTGSEDATVRVWEVATRACLRTLDAHAGPVNSLAFTPDGARLLSASDDRTVRVWDVATWEVARVLEGHAGYVSEVRAAGSDRAVSCGDDGTLRVWDLATGESTREMHQGGWVNAMDVSPDGALAVASNTSNVMRVWDLATGEVARTLVDASKLYAGTVMGMIVAGSNRGPGHASFARHLAWDADGARFRSSSKEVIAWDAATGAELARVTGDGWEITGFARVPGTPLLAAASHDAVALYDLDASALVACAPWDHGGDTHMVAASPDGALLACGAQDGVVGLWSVADLLAGAVPARHLRAAYAVAASPDGARAVTGGADRTARVWDLADGSSRARAFPAGLFVSPVRFTRDGRRAVATNDDGAIVALDPRTAEPLGSGRFAGEGYHPFLAVHELRDGRWLVGSVTGPLTRWDLDALAEGPTPLAEDAGHVTSLDVDPDEQVAVTTAYTTDVLDVRAWDLATGAMRWRAAFSAPGYGCGARIVGPRVAVTTSKGALLVLALHDGAALHALEISPGEFLPRTLALGPDEVMVFGARPARVNIAEGRCTARLAETPGGYWIPLEGEGRALLHREDVLSVGDFAAGTITPPLAIGRASSVTPTAGSPFVAFAPMSPDLSGGVTVVRVPEGERVEIPSPRLEALAPPAPAKKTRAKKAPAEAKPPEKTPAKKTPRKPRVRAVHAPSPAWERAHPAPASGVTYRYGGWTLVVAGHAGLDLVLWDEGARTAIELVAASNGWWHLLSDGVERVVWPHGGSDPQDLFSRPWQAALPEQAVEVAAGTRFEIGSGPHHTTLHFTDDALRVGFCDGRELVIPRHDVALDYDGRRGERIVAT